MEKTFTLLDLFTLGGPVMWPLALFSVLTVAIILEKCTYLLSHSLATEKLTKEVCSIIEQEGKSKALERINQESDKLLCKMAFIAALESEKKCTAVASECTVGTNRFLGFLSALGTVAPITGFLGTVTGMISAFMSIAQADNISARLAATGIFQALITTAFGLVISVVAVVFCHIFTGISEKFAFSLENSCNLILSAKKHED